MKRIKQYYKFLCDYGTATENNAKTAKTYFEELHESGANSAILFAKCEFERVFGAFLDTKESK